MEPHYTFQPLTSFLYELMRDHVPCGVVERLVRDSQFAPGTNAHRLTNGHLGRYAEELALALTQKQETDR